MQCLVAGASGATGPPAQPSVTGAHSRAGGAVTTPPRSMGARTVRARTPRRGSVTHSRAVSHRNNIYLFLTFEIFGREPAL